MAQELRLVDRQRGGFRIREAGGPLLLGATLAIVALLATLAGVDQARRPIEPKQVARQALRTALELGNSHPDVQQMMVDLRRTLGSRPLDSRTRVIYASLLVELSRRVDDTRAAAFHAERAATLAPVTVPVVHLAGLVLVRTGDRDLAAGLIREMFGYDEEAAAELLSEVEALMSREQIDRSIPETADSWLAWARRLKSNGRNAEAVSWFDRAHRQFPEHALALQLAVELAITRGDWEAARDMIPADRAIPDGANKPALMLLRARISIRDGEKEAAIGDIAKALALDGGRAGVQQLAGQAYLDLGEIDLARRQWNRALFQLEPGPSATRRRLLILMARLEDAHGRPGAALRLWDTLLEIDPGNVEAQRRRDDLTGFQR